MKQTLLPCLIAAMLSQSIFAAEPAKFEVGGLKFERPAKWEVQPAGGMRKAQFKVPDAKAGAGAEVVFFHFGPQGGGGVQANVDRWFGQFVEKGAALKSKSEEVKVGKSKVHFVSATGTYMDGPPLGEKTPRANYALYGAIIEAADGSIFVKMTGPSVLTQTAIPAFRLMIESALK
ncbi:MAG: hypothetical protein EXS24_00995 [Pedosphaera sp.]|nr:hypothetical protein [Pedosphaera sp.]